MNISKGLLQRESGNGYSKDYSIALKRLKCFYQDEYYGIEPTLEQTDFNPEPPLYACGFSSVLGYEHLLALGNEEGKIAIQDITVPSSRKQIEGYQAHRKAIYDLAWIPGAFKLVTASGDFHATLWDIQDGNSFEAVMHFTAHSKSVKTVAVCPDNKDVVATGSRDGIIMLWDTRMDAGINLARPDNSISNPHIPSDFEITKSGDSSSNSLAVTASPLVRGRKSLNALASSDAATISGLVFLDDRHLISCGASDWSIKVWDLRKSYSTYRRDPQPTHRLCKSKRGDGMGYTCLVLDSGRVRLYGSCADSTIYAFNVSTFEELPIAAYSGHGFSNFAKSCLSPDDRYLLSGSKDLKAYIWDTTASRRTPELALNGHGKEVTAVAWCPVGDPRLITCSDDGWHRLWRVSEERDDAEDDLANRPCGEAIRLSACSEMMNVDSNKDVDPTPTPTRKGNSAGPSTPATPATPATPRSVLQLTPHSEGGWRRAVEKTPDGSCPSVRGCRNCRGDPNIACTRCKPSSLSGTSKKRLEALWEVNEDLLSPKECQECKREAAAAMLREPAPRGREMRRLFSPGKAYSDLLGIAPICDSVSDVASSSPLCPHRPMSALSSPTLNLPNYVVDGTSPHHTCSRDSRQHKENVDWLTRLRKERDSVEKKKQSAPSPVTPSSSGRSSDRKRPRRRESSVEPGTSGSEHSANRGNRVRSSASIVKFFRVGGKTEEESPVSS